MATFSLLAMASAVAVSIGIASAQCEPRWIPVMGYSGAAPDSGVGWSYSTFALLPMDPDDNGPRERGVLLIGPEYAADLSLNGLGFFDPGSATFTRLNWGLSPVGRVRGPALALSSSDVIAIADTGAYRWNGTVWSRMGKSVLQHVTAFAQTNSGEIWASGGITTPDKVSSLIARWDGTEWRHAAPGIAGGIVTSILPLRDGRILALGSFTSAGALTVNRVAIWNGSAWSALGTGLSATAYSAIELADGRVVVGGSFTSAGGVPAQKIAVWNGATWSAMGAGLDRFVVRTLATLQNGDIVAAGEFDENLVLDLPRGIARWDGTAWRDMDGGLFRQGNGTVWVDSIVPLDDGGLIVMSNARKLQETGIGITLLSRWHPERGWSPVASGFSGIIYTTSRTVAGRTYVGGTFYSIGDSGHSQGIAVWDGGRWRGMPGNRSVVLNIAVLPDGDAVIASSVTNRAGVSIRGAARWNGDDWVAMLGGESITPFVTATPDGGLLGSYVINLPSGYSAGIARWDGSRWTPITNDRITGYPFQARSGDIYISANFATVAGQKDFRLARLVNGAWQLLAPSMESTRGMTEAPNGDIYLWGNRDLVRWDGTSHVIERPTANAFLITSDGRRFVSDKTGAYQRLPGSTEWTKLGIARGLNLNAWDISELTNGDILFGGEFTLADDDVANGLAIWGCRCRGDFDGDGFVTFEDADQFVSRFVAGESAADFDNDGFLTFEDFDVFVAVFEAGC